MSWTKRQFVVQAFEELGLAAYVPNLSADQLQSALRRLDSMMASWNARGIRVGYPLPSTQGSSELAQDTGVPDANNEAIYLGLASRLASSFGKVLSAEHKQAERLAFQSVLSSQVFPLPMQFPGNLPTGAGNKGWRGRGNYMPEPSDEIQPGPDNVMEFT